MMQKYTISRTGRRTSRYPVKRDDGSTLWIKARGNMCLALSAAEAARVAAVPDTIVTPVGGHPAPRLKESMAQVKKRLDAERKKKAKKKAKQKD